MLTVQQIRGDFPVLNRMIHDHPLIYLDNAATTQLPVPVLERLHRHYTQDNANVHRGIHTLSERTTAAYEQAREIVRSYLNAGAVEEIVFTQGTTDGINMVAAGLWNLMEPGDSIIVTSLEHHSNFLPWQRLCAARGAAFVVVPCPDGELDQEFFLEALKHRPKLVAMTQVSNLTGTVFPVREMTALAHGAGALILVDGAQGIRHEAVDVQALDCDFYCFSGHKVCAPSGIGVLYGKRACLEQLEPMRVGGGMVDTVLPTASVYGPLPGRLEAGTPNFSGAIALGEALRYITALGREEVAAREHMLLAKAEELLSSVPEVTVLGSPAHRAGVLSFTLRGIHPYDAASVLDKFGVAVRSGSHCAQPGLREFRLDSAIRLSPAFYNTEEELVQTRETIEQTIGLFHRWSNF